MRREFKTWKEIFANKHMLEIFLIQHKIHLPSLEHTLTIIDEEHGIAKIFGYGMEIHIAVNDNRPWPYERVIQLPDGNELYIYVYPLCRG